MALFKGEKRQVVGISDMKVSKNPKEHLITFSLGSCIGIAIWDHVARVGGVLHYMLPDSRLDKERARSNPYMFGDSGIPMLFKMAYRLGATKQNMTVRVVGGSQLMDSAGIFNIGQRNYEIAKLLFAKNSITPAKVDVGGSVNRTLSVDVATGQVVLKVSGAEEIEI
jgi:chemotaxis protein CheD